MLEIILKWMYSKIVFLSKLKSIENIFQEQIRQFPVKILIISKLVQFRVVNLGEKWTFLPGLLNDLLK